MSDISWTAFYIHKNAHLHHWPSPEWTNHRYHHCTIAWHHNAAYLLFAEPPPPRSREPGVHVRDARAGICCHGEAPWWHAGDDTIKWEGEAARTHHQVPRLASNAFRPAYWLHHLALRGERSQRSDSVSVREYRCSNATVHGIIFFVYLDRSLSRYATSISRTLYTVT